MTYDNDGDLGLEATAYLADLLNWPTTVLDDNGDDDEVDSSQAQLMRVHLLIDYKEGSCQNDDAGLTCTPLNKNQPRTVHSSGTR